MKEVLVLLEVEEEFAEKEGISVVEHVANQFRYAAETGVSMIDMKFLSDEPEAKMSNYDLAKAIYKRETLHKCGRCQYVGDKFSFEQPNDLIDRDEKYPWVRHYYCNCGDSIHYKQDITDAKIKKCESFKEI